MSTFEHDTHANPLLPIFGCQQKSELIDYCAGLEVSSRDLLEVVLRSRAGGFGNYNYVCHVLDAVPKESGLTTGDLQVLSRTPAGQHLKPRDRHLIDRVFLCMDSSKVLAAHMFYTADWSFWYVFCFDSRDAADVRSKRLHLITDQFGLPVEDVWAKATSGRIDFPTLPIDYKQA